VTRYIGGKEGTRLRREVKKLTVTSHQLCRNLNIYRGNLGWILCRFGVDLEWIWGRFGVDWSGFGVDLEWIWGGFLWMRSCFEPYGDVFWTLKSRQSKTPTDETFEWEVLDQGASSAG
jgi:hypothetical protein